MSSPGKDSSSSVHSSYRQVEGSGSARPTHLCKSHRLIHKLLHYQENWQLLLVTSPFSQGLEGGQACQATGKIKYPCARDSCLLESSPFYMLSLQATFLQLSHQSCGASSVPCTKKCPSVAWPLGNVPHLLQNWYPPCLIPQHVLCSCPSRCW